MLCCQPAAAPHRHYHETVQTNLVDQMINHLLFPTVPGVFPGHFFMPFQRLPDAGQFFPHCEQVFRWAKRRPFPSTCRPAAAP